MGPGGGRGAARTRGADDPKGARVEEVPRSVLDRPGWRRPTARCLASPPGSSGRSFHSGRRPCVAVRRPESAYEVVCQFPDQAQSILPVPRRMAQLVQEHQPKVVGALQLMHAAFGSEGDGQVVLRARDQQGVHPAFTIRSSVAAGVCSRRARLTSHHTGFGMPARRCANEEGHVPRRRAFVQRSTSVGERL